MKFPLFLFCLVLLQGCNSEDKFDYEVIEGNGRVALTFDDVAIDNWNNVKHQIEIRGATATFFISRYGDINAPINTRSDYLRGLLYDFEQSGFEIASHTYGHKNVKDFIGEFGIDKWIQDEVKSSLCLMIEDGFSIYSFAYPNSNSNTDESDSELLKMFTQLRLYNGKGSNHSAGIYNTDEQVIMSSAIDEEVLNMNELKDVIDHISENDYTLVLTAHDIAKNNDEQLFIKPSSLMEIIDYAGNKGIEFINFKDILNRSLSKIDYSTCE